MTDIACKTPVKDLLAAIPHDLVIQWQDKDGLKAWHNCPIGRIAQEAIAALEAAEPKPACKPAETSEDETVPAADVEAWIAKYIKAETFPTLIPVEDAGGFIAARDKQHAEAMDLLQSKLSLVLRENRRLSDELKRLEDK